MRDLPPVSPGGQAPVNYEAEGSGTFNSLPRAHPLPRSIVCQLAGSLTAPQRPDRTGAEAEFQPILTRRQLVSRVSLDSPLSPSSRPRSPWGRFDPYDSPEVCFYVLLLPVIVLMKLIINSLINIISYLNTEEIV